MRTTLIAKEQSVWHGLGHRIKSSRFLILMIIPAVVFYAVFCYEPMYGILVAFTDYSPNDGILGSFINFNIGFKNFEYIFTDDPDFASALIHTLIIGTIKILLSAISAIVVALLVNELRMKKFKKISQIIVTFPHFLSWVTISGFIMVIFSSSGIINGILANMGFDRNAFLADVPFFYGLLFISDIWKEAGWGSIIYLATMAGISPDLYEAADIDGATRMQKIWHITLPGIKPTAILLLILSVGGVFSAGFDQIFNLSNDIVKSSVDILDTYVVRILLNNGDAGIGTAIGLFKSLASFVLVITADRIAKAVGERGII